YELIKQLMPVYGDKAALIHVEVYKDPINKVVADSVREWRLQSEPYIFVIDRNGVITDKFEGPVSLAELDQAMKKVTG
ncbi:MAG: TlpA family protein disulfide reductase, partial [Dehalococcoidia bacterium]